MKKIKHDCKYRIFAKGLTQEQRGRLIHLKHQRFGANSRYLIVDGSSFDGSQRPMHLDGLQGCYKSLFPDSDVDLLCSWRRVNRVRTRHGLKAKIEARRMSGDADTSLGNCLVMVACIVACLRAQGITDYELLNDGDDCIVITDGCSVDCGQFDICMAGMGLVTAANYSGSQLESAEFCRARPVSVDGVYVLVNRPMRRLATVLCSHKHYYAAKSGYDVSYAMALSLLATSPGLPILHTLATRLVELTQLKVGANSLARLSKKFAVREASYSLSRKCSDWRSVQTLARSNIASRPSIATRVSFANAFGISPTQQRSIERFYSKLSFEQIDHVLAVYEPGTSRSIGCDYVLREPPGAPHFVREEDLQEYPI
jgi:hypothetical protein